MRKRAADYTSEEFPDPYMPMQQRSARPQGFTLTEMAVVLAIVGLLFAFLIPVSNTLRSNQRRGETEQKLKNIQAALNNFVIINKRLPCPADGTDIGTATSGTEKAPVGGGDCTNDQASGVVPWATLGLTAAAALDAWNDQISYRVGYGLTRSGALDMSYCDPAGAAAATTGWPAAGGGLCATTCTGTFSPANCTSPSNFLANKGLDVTTDGATKVMDHTKYTGAAYILISHGDDNYGAINSAGVYVASPVSGVSGVPILESNNANLPTLTIPTALPNQPAQPFVDATFSDADNPATYFDDIIIRPSVLSVITQAQLGPRSH